MSLNKPYDSISIVILAAGQAKRMGQAKQLLRIGEQTLIERISLLALAMSPNVVVVLGARASLIQNQIESLDVEVVINRDWQQGMGTSLKVGIQHIKNIYPNSEGVLLLVCDQPYVTKTYLNDLLENIGATAKSIIASFYNNKLGVPAYFDKKWFPALSNIQGDKGARKILMTHSEACLSIDFPEGSFDLDTPETYEAFIAKWKKTNDAD